MSNTTFFKRYGGNIYGVTGTLGSETDQQFLNSYFSVDFLFMPTHRPKKFYEEEGEIIQNSDDWLDRMCEKVKFEISPKPWRECGRAVLVICEDINTALKLRTVFKEEITQEVKLYTRSDNEEIQETKSKLGPGDVIVATNLAGRGTDIGVTEEVNASGGLCVLVTFLPTNTRIEKQAFGRTARKGLPGSGQIILNSSTLQSDVKNIRTVKQLKLARDKKHRENMEKVEDTEMADCMLRETLFSSYCSQLRKVYDRLQTVDERERKLVIDSLNEHWGMWLQKKSDMLSDLEERVLLADLTSSVSLASERALRKESPSANIYHLIKFGNEVMLAEKYEDACQYYDRAISVDARWAAIAHYNRAYCTIRHETSGYKDSAKRDLQMTLESLNNYMSELSLTKTFTACSWHATEADGGFNSSMDMREQIFRYFEKNIQESIQKLEEIDGDVIAEATAVFSLVPNAQDDMSVNRELYELWQLGLLNIFTVKKKPRFCFAGLAVFLLGALQVAAGVLLAAVSVGTLTSVGLGLIAEGVSDMIEGVQAMITGQFSWKSWGGSKVLGIAASLLGAGIARLAVQGSNVVKIGKALSKLKTLPKMLSRAVTKKGVSISMKQGLKTAGKAFVKEAGEQVILRCVNEVEDKLIDKFMSCVEVEIHNTLKSGVIEACKSDPLSANVERLAAYYFKDRKKDDLIARDDLTGTFRQLGDMVAKTFTQDSKKKKILALVSRGAIDGVNKLLQKSKKDKISVVLKVVEASYITGSAIISINELVTEFVQRVGEEASDFCDRHKVPKYDEDVAKQLDMEKLKQETADVLAERLSQTVTLILRKKVTSHMFHKLKGHVNRAVGGYTRRVLKTDRTVRKAARWCRW